jgi:DNA (cytosine-5)-methyltransferase 1
MPELHTTDSESSSLLRTPKASDGEGGALGEAEALKRGNSVGVRDQVMDLVASQGAKVSRTNLPTPTVADTFTDNLKSSQQKEGSMHSVNLSQAVHMLPTPLTTEFKSNASPGALRRKTQQLTAVVHAIDFGKFGPAVERWEEVLGVLAPAPTEPDGRDGAHRLSSKFTEWMMGLQPGWVTDHGLSRKDELKLCGNGVVPQQAKLALEVLLDRLG